MPGSSVLEDTWNQVQPRLEAMRNTLFSGDTPTPRVIRVGQLDSEILDKDLAHMLQEPLNKALALINTTLRARFEPELGLIIQLALYKLSIWNTGASYGAKLQDLRYVVPPSSTKHLTPSGLPHRVLLLHGTLTIVIPYLHTRFRAYALSRAWPDAPSSDRRRKAWEFLTSLESTHTLLSLASFVVFLWDGRYRTIADRVLKMSLVPSRRLTKRDVSYEFMNRQMVWHAFTEFLLFLLPLVSARGLRRRMNKILSTITMSRAFSIILSKASSLLGFSPSGGKETQSQPQRGKYWALPRDQCAICAESASFSLNIAEPTNAFTALGAIQYSPSNSSSAPEETSPDAVNEPPTYPIYTPYIASCGDIYCYHCIAERMMRVADESDDETGWECLRCCEVVKRADRYVVEAGSERGTSDYDFSSDMEMDVTDMSGSIGSYSEFSDSSFR